MSSIWNLTHPLRTGLMNLAPAGRELYGTVIKSGVNQKTVTVRVNRFYYVPKYHKTYSRHGDFQVHDEDEFCALGDKVIIKACRPMSKSKRYYVRNIVLMASRPYQGQKLQGTIDINSEPTIKEELNSEEGKSDDQRANLEA